MTNILMGIGGGIGDLIQGINCAHFINQKKDTHADILCFARDETFKPLKHLFDRTKFNLWQHPRQEQYWDNYWVLNNKEVLKQEYPGYDDYEFHCPDLLYRQFKWKRYNVHPQTIRSTRLLTHLWEPKFMMRGSFGIVEAKLIYVGLNTSTPEYVYPQIENFLIELAKAMPNHVIYFNDITQWAGHKIDNNVNPKNLPLSVWYNKDRDFASDLKTLADAEYCICLDNGISHVSHAMGIPRLLISNRLTPSSVAWQSRWYEDLRECLPYSYSPKQLAHVVKTNVLIPETTLIDRKCIADNPNFSDWDKALIFKY